MAIQPAASLTPIPPFPALSDRAAGTYNSKAYTFGTFMGGTDGVTPGQFVTEINALTDNVEHNAQEAAGFASAAADSAASAQTVAAFKGPWPGLSGPLAMPATVLHLNAYWMLTRNVADVAAEVPGISTAWTPQAMDARPLGTGADLNTLVATGAYSMTDPANGPAGVSGDFVAEVIRFGTNAVQALYTTGGRAAWRRRISGITTTPVYAPWGVLSEDAPVFTAVTGGAIDCAKGPNFTATVSANTTFALSNVPAGAYSFVLELYHTGGTITLPTGSVWVAATPPAFNTPRRHLLYFQASGTGSGGWIVSALPNSAV